MHQPEKTKNLNTFRKNFIDSIVKQSVPVRPKGLCSAVTVTISATFERFNSNKLLS